MLCFNSYTDTNTLLFTYMFIYNLTVIAVLWLLFTTTLTNFKTLQSFSSFTSHPFLLTNLTILLFSLAGVPPFVGFLSKIFILTLVLKNSFTLLYTVFLVVLFLGLYFYVQNIRYLHTTNPQILNTPQVYSAERALPVFFYTITTVTVSVVFSLFLIDDILLLFA